MNSDQFFFDDDLDDEVNSLTFEFLKDVALLIYNASISRIPKNPRAPVEGDRYGAHDRLVAAYFVYNSLYDEKTFRTRFRMSRKLFTSIVRDLTDTCRIFKKRTDCTGKFGISPLIKCTSAIRQQAYGVVLDQLDEYLQIVRKTSSDCLDAFCDGVMQLYGGEFLRKPTQTDVEKLYVFRELQHGFPAMLGSIDCAKWPWAQCPVAHRGQFCSGDSGSDPFILLEVVVSQNLWIWHAFFGVAGSNNNINVIHQSTLLNNLKQGKAPKVPFVANDVNYRFGYYLTDKIYPEWVVLIKSISEPGSNDHKRIRYKNAHKAARKDVERAFGVLKRKWATVKTPARSRSLKRITKLMYTCIILHNMIIQDQGMTISPDYFPEEVHREDDSVRSVENMLELIKEINNKETHLNLKAGLVEHI